MIKASILLTLAANLVPAAIAGYAYAMWILLDKLFQFENHAWHGIWTFALTAIFVVLAILGLYYIDEAQRIEAALNQKGKQS